MQKDDAFWLNVCYVALTLMAAYVYWKAINTVGIETGWLERYDQWFVPGNHIGSIALGLLTVFLLRRSPERNEYFLESIGELRKVVWPSFDDTRKMTIIVCVVVAVFSAVLAVFDVAWSYVLKQIIS